MKCGFVDAFVDKMLFHGSAGVGKTCTRNIVAGEKTTNVRHSTPIATRPVTVYQMQSSKELWHKYTSEQRMQICAQLSKLGLGPELIDALKQEAATSALDAAREEVGNQEESDRKQIAYPGATALQPEQLAVQVSEQHAESSIVARSPTATAQASVDPNVIKVIQEVLDKMFELIDKCPESEDPITFLHKLLVTDCGGQPQFHEILPIFLKKMSMIVFVIKLSEELSNRPMIEYYENGKPLGTPYESDFTTEQLLQQGLRSLHSHRSSKDKGGDAPQIVVIGTHRDEESKCEESRQTKNQKLREMLLPTFKDEIVYYQAATSDILFPMNAKCPGKEEEDMAQVVRNRVHRSNPRRIPLPWMALEIVLDEITHVLQRGLLHKNECFEVARRLHFDESTLEAALMYLDELSLILYYPDILPDLVFTNPQVLLDKVSELVKVHHDKKKNSGLGSGDKAWQEFFNHALVTINFLSQEDFKKHYVPGLFMPENLLTLCRKLFIFAYFSEGKFFVPCLLRMLGHDDVSKYRLSHDYHFTPLVLHFTDGPPRRGIFCAVLCFLTSPENHFPGPWKLKMPSVGSVTPTCLHRNCVQFTIPGVKVPCTVTFIDTLLQFELHVKVSKSAACKICPIIKRAISAGLQKANIALGYTNSIPSFAFLCPCGAGEPHPASIGDGFWICTLDEGEGDEFSPNQQLWLDGDVPLEGKSGIALCIV